MSSILNDIKQTSCGLIPEDISFDTDIIMHTNTTFFILNQLNVGPKEPFHIVDNTTTWDDFFKYYVKIFDDIKDKTISDIKDKTINNLSYDLYKLECIKTYIMTRVKLFFDPPANSTLMESYKRVIEELEYRMLLVCDV